MKNVSSSGFGLSEEVREFIGDNKIANVTSEGVTYANGEYKEFPEKIVLLPVPAWLVTISGCGCGNDWAEALWFFYSQALGMVETFTKELFKALSE